MRLDTLEEIERAINALPPQDLAELYSWLDQRRSPEASCAPSEPSVFKQGLGLFSGSDDAALLDEVVRQAYEERRRPSDRAGAL